MSTRQRRLLATLVGRLVDRPWLEAAIVVGSLATDTDDHMSDIDLLVAVSDFRRAWDDRSELEGGEALASWDADLKDAVGTHRWVTRDLVLVECLLGEVGAFRLAEPYRVLAGNERIVERIPRRPRITRDEMRRGDRPVHPIERLYDELKEAVRSERRSR